MLTGSCNREVATIMDQGMSAAPAAGHVSSRRKCKPKRANHLNSDQCGKLSADEEGDLVQMLNDSSSELYRLFSHHNPNKSPQQCYLELKYCPPEDLESKSLYEKVLKYAQLHRKLGKRIKKEKPRIKAEPVTNTCAIQTSTPKKHTQHEVAVIPKFEVTKDARHHVVPPVSQFPQKDGCQESIMKQRTKVKHDGEQVRRDKFCELLMEKVKERDEYRCENPLYGKSMKSKRVKEEVPEDAILKSYHRALTTGNVDSDLRLALLDEDCRGPLGSNGCGDGLIGCGLPSLMRRDVRRPPIDMRTGNCTVSRPVRANRIQHSLSSVSSIEVHKTNTTCSMSSSTSISISTCEIVSGVKDVKSEVMKGINLIFLYLGGESLG